MIIVYFTGFIILLIVSLLYYAKNKKDLNDSYVVDVRFLCIWIAFVIMWPFTLVFLVCEYGIEKYLDWEDK